MKQGGLVTPEFAEDANCTAGIQWIKNVRICFVCYIMALQVFTDCVDTELKLIGFIIGIMSLLLWLVPLFPQLWQNYKTKRCEGLSLAFLFFW